MSRQSGTKMAHRGNPRSQVETQSTPMGNKPWEINSMKDEIVASINRYRAYHRSPALIRNPQIEREHSDKWAKKVVQTDNFQHSDDEKYGENIYAGTLTSGYDPVDVWYWHNKFDYSDAEKSLTAPGCGHFTAMVWKETTEVGIGIHPFDEEGTYVVVASFYPPGNIIGTVSKNVIRPRSRVTRPRR